VYRTGREKGQGGKERKGEGRREARERECDTDAARKESDDSLL
jgi:hypothetical protein